MRITWAVMAALLVLTSCARIPYEQWNGQLEGHKSTLEAQRLQANVIAGPDERLFSGVMNATRNREAEPYTRLSSVARSLTIDKETLITETDSVLNKLEKFRSVHGTKSISTVGPDYSDYQQALSQAKMQSGMNKKRVIDLVSNDLIFDSLCNAYKIKAVPMLNHEVELAEKMNALEDRFMEASNQYQKLKRDITSKPDAKASMTQLNGMKQKVRQIESELLQYSNLYSRVSSLRADAMIYEGPYIETMAEIKLIEEKSRKIDALLEELEEAIKIYK